MSDIPTTPTSCSTFTFPVKICAIPSNVAPKKFPVKRIPFLNPSMLDAIIAHKISPKIMFTVPPASNIAIFCGIVFLHL